MAKLKEGQIVYHVLDARKMVCIDGCPEDKRKGKQVCRFLSPDQEYLEDAFWPYELSTKKPKKDK